ncbi:MAG: DUF87 domain-containing protein [Calditrichaeota bacterium]|nr:MAG: DUF87 domain-containing protein [Calditrichota bacterium]
MQDFEKLGAFYLGKMVEPKNKSVTEQPLLYNSKDLTTHAVCIGMTGSGKTGLCISLLEEAGIDNIPAIIIDPKGDMTNLLLTFPDLAPQSFLPWVNETEANNKGMSPNEYAKKLADQWKEGLQQWGQTGERIAMLRNKVDMNIYTPGSSAGLPVSILKSFSAPSQQILDDEDSLNERVASTTSSLLGLLGIDADPVKSREHILLSTIFHYFWRHNKDIDLAQLITAVQTPPVQKIGVFDVETFYPAKERFELAMALNNFLAAPGFAAWLDGAPLSPDSLLFSGSGKPSLSIFYIAHLSDPERMFFVSLLLNQIVSWMRSQPGTPSLRMILYFDELFGYLPPVGEPASKKPLLTLLKQGRAFGVGTVLATQNPVDLDYKALANTGTWFIGRLQTERDRDRILDGLASLAAGADALSRSELSQIITGLEKRQFLMHNINEKGPIIFNTRWALSYLYGPLTREQIKVLTGPKTSSSSTPSRSQKQTSAATDAMEQMPHLPPDIRPLFLPLRSAADPQSKIVYHPFLWGSAKLTYIDKSLNIDLPRKVKIITSIIDAAIPVEWNSGSAVDCDENDLCDRAEEPVLFASLPRAASMVKNYSDWKNTFKEYLISEHKLTLFRCTDLEEVSLPDESERDFRIRLSQKGREQRDDRAEKLQAEFEKKIMALQMKQDRVEDRLEREKQQARQQTFNTAISVGATVLGAFLGRKIISRSSVSKASSAVRQAGRTMKESGDVRRVEDETRTLQAQIEELEAELQDKLNALPGSQGGNDLELTTLSVSPNKSLIVIQLLNFVWAPMIQDDQGRSAPAF